jgi:transposase
VRRRIKKKWDGSGGQDEQALGRSRGGFTTKVHAAVNGLGQPVELTLTPGQASDIGQAEQLLADHAPEAVVADRGYDSRALVAEIEARGGEAVIPTRKSCTEQRAIDRHVYKERNVVERFWSKVKHYRRVATRYEKKAVNFLAFVKVAAIMVLLQ